MALALAACARRCALPVALLAACSSAPQVSMHPLEGRIWDVQAARFVSQEELLQRLAAARYRLLGEIHDNAAHHTLRARLIDGLARNGARPAVVFEQFDAAADGALARAQTAGADAEALADAGGLDRKGWRWPMHKPLLEAALAHHLPVRGGNLPREQVRRIARGNLAPELGDRPWSDAQQASLRKDLADGHCAALPEAALGGMALAQRARDASMARALVAGGPGAILIAGNSHVRRDRGVPAYLDGGAIAVRFVEVRDGESRPQSYGLEDWDFAWLTARAPREDPCAPTRG